MKPVVQEWLEFAKTDLKAAELLISDPTLTAPVSFHSQQCAEKCLKAVVESIWDEPNKTNALNDSGSSAASSWSSNSTFRCRFLESGSGHAKV